MTTPLALLAQADVLLALSRGFGRPDVWLGAQLADALEALEGLATDAGIPAQPLGPVARGARELLATTAFDAWEAEHARLFDGPTWCSPYETGYVRRDRAAILADVAAFHRAFTFALAPGSDERPDHLVAELELLAMLLAAEAKARADGDDSAAGVAAEAATAFAREHLAEWVVPFADNLANRTELPLFRALAELLAVAWSAWASVRGVPAVAEPPPIPGALGPDGDPDLQDPLCGDCGRGAGPELVNLGTRSP